MEDAMTFWQKFKSLPPVGQVWITLGMIFMPLMALRDWPEDAGLLVGGPIMALTVWKISLETFPRFKQPGYWAYIALMALGCFAFYFSKASIYLMGIMLMFISLSLLDIFKFWDDKK
jgi:hypothetical protein